MTKFKITATIPVGQYANIQPEIETEALTFEEAQAEAMGKLEQLWGQYGTVPLNKNVPGSRKLLTAFCGGEVYYDDSLHQYTNESGEIYLSGSVYASQFEKPFDSDSIAGKMATKYGVESKDIQAMWELKADTSRTFGTALHKALELYGHYNGLATALERDTAMHDHKVIKHAVESFYNDHKGEEAIQEALIVDHAAKRAGQIDRLLITGPMKARVQDYKTNAVLDKAKLEVYWKQLDFYAGILKAGGWTVEGLDIFHYDGQWHNYRKEYNV